MKALIMTLSVFLAFAETAQARVCTYHLSGRWIGSYTFSGSDREAFLRDCMSKLNGERDRNSCRTYWLVATCSGSSAAPARFLDETPAADEIAVQ